MSNEDVAAINEVVSNHIKSYLVTNFVNSIMGRGEKTAVAINDVLSKKGTHIQIQEMLPNVDAGFIRKMIAILSINVDFCEIMKGLGVPKEEVESVITARLKKSFSE